MKQKLYPPSGSTARLSTAEKDQILMILSMWSGIETQLSDHLTEDTAKYRETLVFNGFPAGSVEESFARHVTQENGEYNQFEGRVEGGPKDALKRNVALRAAYDRVLDSEHARSFREEDFDELVEAYIR